MSVLSVSSVAAAASAIARAHRVLFASYVLQPDGTIEHALAGAARRGATVKVRLQGGLPADMALANRRCAQRLRAAGAAVAFVRPRRGTLALHVKAAVCDSAVYLSDCNWRERGNTVLRDTGRVDVRHARDAILQNPAAGSAHLVFEKSAALRLEASLIDRARRGSTVRVETETLGYSAVSKALAAAADRGVKVRLLVNARAAGAQRGASSRAVRTLSAHRIEIRETSSTEKLAVTAHGAWTGSANATTAHADFNCIDWGIRTNAPAIRAALQRTFDASWRDAKAAPE